MALRLRLARVDNSRRRTKSASCIGTEALATGRAAGAEMTQEHRMDIGEICKVVRAPVVSIAPDADGPGPGPLHRSCGMAPGCRQGLARLP